MDSPHFHPVIDVPRVSALLDRLGLGILLLSGLSLLLLVTGMAVLEGLAMSTFQWGFLFGLGALAVARVMELARFVIALRQRARPAAEQSALRPPAAAGVRDEAASPPALGISTVRLSLLRQRDVSRRPRPAAARTDARPSVWEKPAA